MERARNRLAEVVGALGSSSSTPDGGSTNRGDGRRFKAGFCRFSDKHVENLAKVRPLQGISMPAPLHDVAYGMRHVCRYCWPEVFVRNGAFQVLNIANNCTS